MKRGRKELKNWFIRRLQAERNKQKIERNKLNTIIQDKQTEILCLNEALSNARNLNLTLDVKNSILKERITALKTKKWYQFFSIELPKN